MHRRTHKDAKFGSCLTHDSMCLKHVVIAGALLLPFPFPHLDGHQVSSSIYTERAFAGEATRLAPDAGAYALHGGPEVVGGDGE